MKWFKWLGIMAAVVLIASCFTPFVIISSKNIIVSGIDATGTNFGKPGYFHFLAAFIFITFSLIPKIWAKRSNLLVAALNLAWAVRNYFLLSACLAGICPEKKTGLYLIVLASLLMLAAALFPDIKLTNEEKK